MWQGEVCSGSSVLCIYLTFLPPVSCGVPHAPENGIIENSQGISTVGGAQIFFRCSPGFVPAGRMSATCVSPDGVSVVGTWTPDPANLMCNGEIQNRHKSDETTFGVCPLWCCAGY